MGSIDLGRVEARARRRYEWSRALRALLGFAPALLVVAAAALLGKRPASAVAFGALLFALGVFLLWHGREIRRAVLPGFAAGVFPLALTLCANRMGHLCTGDHCVSWCLPACTLGGLAAGAIVATLLRRGKHGLAAWLAASGVALLTGAMGCTCVGYSGVIGLALGYGVALLPALARRALGQHGPSA
jgi:hypothetical protein